MITTFTTTAAEDLRIVVAFGHKLGLPGNATGPQVKADIIAYISRVVIDDENRVAALNPGAPIIPT